MGGCGSPSRKVYGSEEEHDVMMVYTACGEGHDGWRCGGDEDGSQISRGQLSDNSALFSQHSSDIRSVWSGGSSEEVGSHH